jgi:hypothetical protein
MHSQLFLVARVMSSIPESKQCETLLHGMKSENNRKLISQGISRHPILG